MIDGMVDSQEISEAFAKYFARVCKPNSDDTNSRLRDMFDARFINYSGDDLKRSDLFTVENICKIICDLKIGKAAGFDNIESEHLLYCHPVVHVYITYLCNLILLTGHVPLEFGRGIIFPIPKGNLGSKIASVEDFRGISVCPLISKNFRKRYFGKICILFENIRQSIWFQKGPRMFSCYLLSELGC